MHEVQEAPRTRPLRPPAAATLPGRDVDLLTLFRFMAEAELRFQTLRMRIVDRRIGTTGESIETSEVWVRHPGHAKVVQGRGDATARDFDVWVSNGETVETYTADNNVATQRRVPPVPVGTTDPALPAFARLYLPVTPLPAETLADTFVHPHGFCRNVLATGATRKVGTAVLLGDREALVLRCDHPRVSHVLTDRPDHWLEVAVDYQTGLILLLAEHIGGRITRHGEVTSLALDEPIGDEAFRIHVSADTRTLY
ncbi:MAG: hypothetical protein M3N29_10940 [Chloroflexota bacterium]|nr:hypothetical protein [Chloroflexota bacterium]